MPSTRLVGLAKTGTAVPPELIVELSSLPASVKKRAMAHLIQSQQPKPHDLQAHSNQAAAGDGAGAGDRRHAELYVAQAQKASAEAAPPACPTRRQAAAPHQVDTAADLAKAQLDLAKAKQIYQELSDPHTPGAFADNAAKAAKAQRDLAEARRKEAETSNIMRHGAAEPAMIPPPPPKGGKSSD